MSTPPNPAFVGFWKGFEDPYKLALDKVPPYADVVTLFTTGPGDANSYDTRALTATFSTAQIKTWIQILRARGQRVLMSIYDNPDHHWNQVDIPHFVANATAAIVDDWGCDGVDLDLESDDASSDALVKLISEFRRQLGPDHLVIADAYYLTDDIRRVMQNSANDLDWVNLMAYFLYYQDMVDRFEQFAFILGPEKLTIGVKPGKDRDDQSTPLDEVERLVSYKPASGQKRGMMLFNFNRDVQAVTGQKPWAYSEAIRAVTKGG